MVDLVTSLRDEGEKLGTAARAGLDVTLPSCPEWTGRDLLAHTCGFTRYVCGLIDGSITSADGTPRVDPREAADVWDDDLTALVTALSDTPADAPIVNWSIAPDTAAFWLRRAAHEFAVHRWDAETAHTPTPIPTDLARDGIAEYFEVFVATGLAVGMVEPTAATIVLDPTDRDERIEQGLPDPGPETVLRGTTSDLLLALWHRRDPLDLFVDGDRAVVERWPRI